MKELTRIEREVLGNKLRHVVMDAYRCDPHSTVNSSSMSITQEADTGERTTSWHVELDFDVIPEGG